MKRTVKIHAAISNTGQVNAGYYETRAHKDVTDVGILSDLYYEDGDRWVEVEIEVKLDIDELFKTFTIKGEVVK